MTNTPIFCNCANNINGMCYGGNGATAYIDTVSRAHDEVGNQFLPTQCPGYKTPDQEPDKVQQGDVKIGPRD